MSDQTSGTYVKAAHDVVVGDIVCEADGFMWDVLYRSFENGRYKFVLGPRFLSMAHGLHIRQLLPDGVVQCRKHMRLRDPQGQSAPQVRLVQWGQSRIRSEHLL